MSRLDADATLTKLGDIYQYILALDVCLGLNENEQVYLEICGDISKVAEEGLFQIESKHHIEDRILSDRHIDFWKTIRNWVRDYHSSTKFNSLILFTTSEVSIESIFYDWNNLSKEVKLERIRAVGAQKKTREGFGKGGFRDLYDEIMDYEDRLEETLDKVILQTGQPKIYEIQNRIRQNQSLLSVEDSKKDALIDTLLGYIIRIPTKPPYNWIITYEGFKKAFVDARDRYTENSKLLIDIYALKEPVNNHEYIHRPFVNEIRNIELDSEIEGAITDVWRKNMTVMNYYSENYSFLTAFDVYKDELLSTLKHKEKIQRIRCKNKSDEEVLNASQEHFLTSMDLPLKSIGDISENRDFFQRGTVHEIVDEGSIKWNLGVKS